MPRDLHRLASPAVFCNSVRRSCRRRSPRRNASRQRDRLLDNRECEYDDYAAEIASYNRLRRGERSAASSASSTSRCTHDGISYYDDSAHTVLHQSDARYLTSHIDTDERLRVSVSAYRTAPCISDDYIHHESSQLDYDDRQQRKHKKKRRHHHCHSHSRSKIQKNSENGSSHHPPRDTIAALKALAEYDDTKVCSSSITTMHYYDSPRNSQQERSQEQKCPATTSDIADVEKPVTINASLSSSAVECSKDDLSLGECSDDDEDETVSAAVHTMHNSPRSGNDQHSLSLVEQSEHRYTSSTDVPVLNCLSITVSSNESTKKVCCSDATHSPNLIDDSMTQSHPVAHCGGMPDAVSSTESKVHQEPLLTKHEKNSSDLSGGQSSDHLKHSADNKRTSAVVDRSSSAPDEKRDAKHKSHSSESTRNSGKKSSTGDDRRKAVDDTSLPRFVTYFCH